MKPAFTTLLMILFLPAINFCQQLPTATEQKIPVCCNVTAADNEFSGLTRWRNYVLLIPQHVLPNDHHHLIAIDTASIDSVLHHQADSVFSYTIIKLDSSLNTIIQSIQQAIGKHNKYGGFEAAVSADDSLFFTTETDSLCYVVKGIITKEKNEYRVVFKTSDTLCLQKPDYFFANAGFESLAYLPASKQLISFYENNNLPNAATGYTFNTHFANKQPLHFDKPLVFRLTDVTAVKDSAGNDALLGINYFYNDFKKDTGTKSTEFDYYLTGDTNKLYSSRQLNAAFAEMHGGNLLKDCFSRIIRLQIHTNTVSWKEVQIIGYQCNNWEGITSYKKGVLLIVDGKPPGVNCTLSYFELDKEP